MTKKIYLMLLSIFLSITYLSAQVVQTVNVSQAGGLATAIGNNLKTVTDLTLAGTINASDFNTIKQMTALKNLDMSAVNIVEKAIPNNAFENRVLKEFIMPSGVKIIGDRSFLNMKVSKFDLSKAVNLETIGMNGFNGMITPELDFSKNINLQGIGFHAFADIKLTKNILDFTNSPKLKAGAIYGGVEGYGAFASFRGHVILPKDMKKIFDNAFAYFTGTLEMPSGIEAIGNNAFKNSNLDEFIMPSGVKIIGDRSFLNMKVSKFDLSKAVNLETIGMNGFNGMITPELDFSKNINLQGIGFHAFADIKLTKNILDFTNSPKLKAGAIYGGAEGYGAFASFRGHVILPKDMKKIFDNAFAYFTGTLEMPSGIEAIGNNAFKNSNLDEFIMPSGVKIIGDRSFLNMKVSKFDLSKAVNLETIGMNGFNGMITPELDFSKNINLQGIGFHAFADIKLTKNILDFTNSPKLKAGAIYGGAEGYGAFASFRGHVILPKDMKKIFDNAFAYFTGTLEMPSGIEAIGNNAFKNSNLDEFIMPSGVKIIGDRSFLNMKVSKFDLSKAVNLETIGMNGFNGMITPELDFSKNINLQGIGFHAFADIKLTKNILDFTNSPKLKAGAIYGGAEGYGAFASFRGHVILPKDMKKIFDNAFAYFTGTLEMPSGIEAIGNNAFKNSNLDEFIMPSGVKIIGDRSFLNMKVSKFDLSKAVNLETIGMNGFNGMITPELDFSKNINLQGIGFHAFADIKLTKNILDFTNSPKLKAGAIYGGAEGYGAFASFRGHVILPKDMKKIFDNAFAYFTGTLEMPLGIEAIGNNAFKNSTIISIELPSSVTSIGSNAFYNATKLEKIISHNPTPPTLGSNVFAGVNKETTVLEVPKESLSLYGTASQWKDFLNVNAIIPKELDVQYSHDGVNFTDYHAVRIGEYYWIDKNFHHKIPLDPNSEYGRQGFEGLDPTTQAQLDKYLPLAELRSQDYQVDMTEFDYWYGLYYDWVSADFMQRKGKIYVNNKISSGWGLPSYQDYQQLIGMSSPEGMVRINGDLTYQTLAPKAGENAFAFNFENPDIYGRRVYWFPESNTNKHKFNLMPTGFRLHVNGATWSNGITDPENGTKIHKGLAGDFATLFYTSYFWFNEYRKVAIIHECVSFPADNIYSYVPVRFARRLTDEELGYKLYVNESAKDIIQLNLNQSAPTGYTELAPGYLRGFYVDRDFE